MTMHHDIATNHCGMLELEEVASDPPDDPGADESPESEGHGCETAWGLDADRPIGAVRR